MQQKVLVFDVDGTLYDMVHHEIPSSAIASIKKAKEKLQTRTRLSNNE